MKTTNIWRLGAVLLVFLISSCSKDQISNNNGVDRSLREQLSKKLNSFELTELDPAYISKLANSQQNAMVKLELVDGKYVFELKNITPSNTLKVEDMAGNSTEDLKLEYSAFDNYDQAQSGSFANFSYVNGSVYGSFLKDGNSYTVAPAQQIVSTAPANAYVIYPDEDYKAPEISENIKTDKVDAQEYAQELKELEMLGSTSDKTTSGPYTVTINAFTSNEFRIYCKSKKQKVYPYIINNILAVNQKLIQGNMPVRVVLNKITNLSTSHIPADTDIVKIKNIYFNAFIRNNPQYREDANVLFTANTIDIAAPSPWTIGRAKRMPTLAIGYIESVSQRDNWLAHELGHMLGCKHHPRNNSAIPGVMNPYIYTKAAEYKAITKTRMTSYTNSYHDGI